MTRPEQIEPSFKKVRGRSKSTKALIAAMKKIAEETHPITGRGIGYKLFAAGLIGGMNEMNVVYRALKIAREEGTIPWEWVIDETRELELISTWRNPSQCAGGFFYRRDLWQTQSHTVEVWSEKGTVRGVLWPVLSRLGVGFRVMHGFRAPPACGTSRTKAMMIVRWLLSISAIGILPGCACPSTTCPSGSRNTMAITSHLSALL